MAESIWTDADAAALTKYISTHPNFLRELKRRMPEIRTDNTEGAAMSGARFAGAQDLVKAIDDMQGSQADVRTTPFINAEEN